MSRPKVLNAQFIAYIGVANGSSADNPRCINAGILPPPYDWHRLTGAPDPGLNSIGLLNKYYNAGFRRIMLWMPFGQDLIDDTGELANDAWEFETTLNGMPYSGINHLMLDHYLRCPDDEQYGSLKSTFVPAIGSWTAAHPDVELIVYTGNHLTDNSVMEPDWSVMPALEREERFWASIQPFLDVGASIAFDVGSIVGPAQPSAWLAVLFEELRQMGVRVYVEPFPYAPNTNLFSYGAISLTAHYRAISSYYDWPAYNGGNPISGGFMGYPPKSTHTGEKMLLLVDRGKEGDLIPVEDGALSNYYKKQMLNYFPRDDVDSVQFEPYYWVNQDGLTLADVGRCARGRVGSTAPKLVATG
jgi:hypothetical protein